MQFRTRAFLLTFVPLAFLLGLSFLLVQGYVRRTVRIGLLNSLRQSERQVAQLRDENMKQNARLLQAFSQDEELKAAVRTFHGTGTAQLTAETSGDPDGTSSQEPPAAGQGDVLNAEDMPPVTGSLQEQLLRMGVKGGVDFIMVASPDGTPLAGAVRAGGDSAELVPLFVFPQMNQGGLVLFRGEPFQTASAPIDFHGTKLGSLILGERLNVSSFATSTVLLHHDWVSQSDIEKSRLAGIGLKLSQCKAHGECTVVLNGVEWLAMPVLDRTAGADWALYSLVNVDDSLHPVESALRHIFLSILFISLLTALICSFAWSRAIVQPLAAMMEHLHGAVRTGRLPEFKVDPSGVREIRELEESFNRAAGSVRKAHGDLNEAYLQFVYALANALDARDCYTAGHSKRVSDLACAIAAAMGQGEEDLERLRVGALLHDIGKIGIPDSLLQYPGRLSNEQFKTIKTHPLIGRRILQNVEAFAMYLPAVELHHENWDGTGYPKRQQGGETPLDARIIHVADAYDAMTTDRAYRKGMGHDQAMQILAENAGTQFDPDVVAVLFQLSGFAKFEKPPAEQPLAESLTPVVSIRGGEPLVVNVRGKLSISSTSKQANGQDSSTATAVAC